MTQLAIRDGAWPILLTAFDGDNTLDLAAIGALLDFYRDLKLPGVLALGQASEMLLLDHDERFRVAECVARHPRGGLAAAAVGNYGATLAEQADSLQRIHDLGTDVAVVALSLLPSADGLADQLLELAGLVAPDVRLGLYEIPEPEHRLLSPEEVSQVAASNRFYFMKDTCRQIAPFSAKVRAAAGTNLKLYQANLAVLPPSMEAGGAGFCGWLPIVAPELSEQVCDLRLPAQLRRRAHDKLMAFNDLIISSGFPASGKYLLSLRGVPIQPYSRRDTAEPFFAQGPAALDDFVARNDPFRAIELAGQP
ncbi:MAG: dihydrodipicolinate synthase family protein [Anaerolineae bacterium]|nr:dihydrodipicolinate synthase family protein [Anaerolineae bacterium]